MNSDIINLSGDRLKDSGIVVAVNAAEPEKFAAVELQRYLYKATGVELPIEDFTADKQFNLIIGDIGKQYVSDENMEFRHDGFVIHCDEDKLIIFGNNPRGTLNGIYTFLHEMGFRWIFPRTSEEFIPALIDLEFTKGTMVVNPDLELRGVCIFPVDRENIENLREIIDWMGKNRINMLMTSLQRTNPRKLGWTVNWLDVSDELLPELQKRGIMLNISEHSGRYFFPTAYFKDHPEWFALDSGGKRSCKGQICYSNREAVEILAENYVNYVKEHPEVDIIGTWPEDGYGFCQCKDCKQPGAVLKAANRIAEKIEAARPDLTVEYLSYTAETSEVPEDILPRANMSILVANTRVANEWKKKNDKIAGKGVYQLNYHISDNTAARASLPLSFQKIRGYCQEAKEIGSRGIIPFYIGIDTWWRSSLTLYFMSRFSWDLSKSTDEILRDFCEKYFENCPDEAFYLFKALESMPMVNQNTTPPWPLWQDWPDMKKDFTGENWTKTVETFDRLRNKLKKVVSQCGNNKKQCNAVEAFIDSSQTMFSAWHERALAVQAFEENDRLKVEEHIKKAGRYEQAMVDLHNASIAVDLGVNGAWPDYSFFQNWRLQLDQQLMEMRTAENMLAVTDENPDVELFLPGLLDL
jgi:hypothetical protein